MTEVGAVFSVPTGKHLWLKEVAAKLNGSGRYVRQHPAEFPNAWRMAGGDIRVPERDVDEFAKWARIKPPLINTINV
ncbi:MAG: hypothetical protein WCS42_10755 [Verrucomicrobiota bacterium]